MTRFHNLLRHDWQYAGLGLLCALLVAGLPACLALFGSRAQPVAQAAAQPFMQVVTLPAPEGAGLNTSGLRPPGRKSELSRQLPAIELLDDGLYAIGELDPSICGPIIMLHELHELHGSHGNEPEVWLFPDSQKGAAPAAN